MDRVGDSAVETARAYYRTLDTGAYDELASLLRSDFTHYRPDRTLEGRDRFVRFMREERPVTDTTHEIEAVYRAVEDADDADEIAVRGRLLDPEGEALFGFLDVHEHSAGGIAAIRTYTR